MIGASALALAVQPALSQATAGDAAARQFGQAAPERGFGDTLAAAPKAAKVAKVAKAPAKVAKAPAPKKTSAKTASGNAGAVKTAKAHAPATVQKPAAAPPAAQASLATPTAAPVVATAAKPVAAAPAPAPGPNLIYMLGALLAGGLAAAVAAFALINGRRKPAVAAVVAEPVAPRPLYTAPVAAQARYVPPSHDELAHAEPVMEAPAAVAAMAPVAFTAPVFDEDAPDPAIVAAIARSAPSRVTPAAKKAPIETPVADAAPAAKAPVADAAPAAKAPAAAKVPPAAKAQPVAKAAPAKKAPSTAKARPATKTVAPAANDYGTQAAKAPARRQKRVSSIPAE